jgi:hypothetical protein
MAVLCFCFTPVCFSESDLASVRLVCDNNCIKLGKSFKVKTFIDSDSKLNVNSFKFTVKYDSSKVIYNSFTAPKGTSRKNFNVNSENDLLYIEYVCKKSDLLVDSSLNICNFTFDSKDDADSSECKFEILSFEIADGNKRNFSLSNLDNLTIDFEPVAKANCYLSRLIPSSGRLAPDFSKDIFEYSVDVDHDISFLDFDVYCENEFATSKINRRKLASAGKDTKINIVVNDKKAKSKLTYVVNVHRCEKPVTDKKIAENATAKSKPGTSRKKSEKNKSKSSGDKSKSNKEKSENSGSNGDSTDNYIALNNTEGNDNNSKNYFSEKLIGGFLVILVLGGFLIYNKFSRNK